STASTTRRGRPWSSPSPIALTSIDCGDGLSIRVPSPVFALCLCTRAFGGAVLHTDAAMLTVLRPSFLMHEEAFTALVATRDQGSFRNDVVVQLKAADEVVAKASAICGIPAWVVNGGGDSKLGVERSQT